MNSINFINTIPPQRQQEILRWFRGTIAIVVGSLLVIGYLQYKQWRRLQQAQSQQAQQNAYLKKLEKIRTATTKLNAESAQLKERIALIEERTHRAQNPVPYLTTLNNATGQHIQLSSFSYNNQQIHITGTASSAKEVTAFIKRLTKAERFAGITLASLQPSTDTKRITFTLKKV